VSRKKCESCKRKWKSYKAFHLKANDLYKQHKKKHTMSAGKIVSAVLAGVAVGAALGILFAPEKGTEIRRKIAKKGKDYADELGEKANEFMDGITEKYETVKDDALRMTEQGKRKAEQMGNNIIHPKQNM
jgi:gas vesicle protein